MDASANAKQQWAPEVAARLRGAMIAFVLVLLLSMVFTIAYVAGRTLSGPAADSRAKAPESPTPTPASMQMVSARGVESPLPIPVQHQPAAVPKETVTRPQPRQPAVMSKEAVVPKEPVKQEGSATPKVETSSEPPSAGEPPLAEGASAGSAVIVEEEDSERIGRPQPGHYLQVGAVDLASAEKMVRTIKKNGLSAVVAPGASAGIFRVVVGPLDSQQTAAQARDALTERGYQMFPRRY